jgi:hypothetical protein
MDGAKRVRLDGKSPGWQIRKSRGRANSYGNHRKTIFYLWHSYYYSDAAGPRLKRDRRPTKVFPAAEHFHYWCKR